MNSGHLNNSDINVLVDSYLQKLDYDLSNIDESMAESYTSHPINAFHLMKRTSTLMPKIQEMLQNESKGGANDEVRNAVHEWHTQNILLYVEPKIGIWRTLPKTNY